MGTVVTGTGCNGTGGSTTLGWAIVVDAFAGAESAGLTGRSTPTFPAFVGVVDAVAAGTWVGAVAPMTGGFASTVGGFTEVTVVGVDGQRCPWYWI